MQHNLGITYFPNYAAKPLRTYKEFGKKSRYAKTAFHSERRAMLPEVPKNSELNQIQSLTIFRA